MIYLLIAGNMLMGLTFLFRFNSLPPQLPLFYTRPWGEEQLADSWVIIMIPVFANMLFFLNDYLYKKYFLGNMMVKKMSEFLSVFLFISFTLLFVKIIFLIS